MSPFPRILALTLLLTLLPVPAHGQTLEREVTGNETWTLRAEVADVLTIRSGATLELRGSTLTIGDRIVVERGATLKMGPEGGVATRLQPVVGGRFWIDVQGHVESSGEPRTRITGIEGKGLDSVIMMPGGLKVNGTADLSDLHIDNGTAGIIVLPGATLRLTDSRFDNLYLMGIAVQGTAIMERVQGTNNIIGVTGRGRDCRLEMRDSTMESWAANFQIVNCPTVIEDSALLKGNNNVVLSGTAPVEVRRTRIEGYTNVGLQSDGATPVTLEEVVLEPEGNGKFGIEMLAGGDLTFRHLKVGSHRDSGIKAGMARMSFEDVEVAGSDRFGLAFVDIPEPVGLDGVRLGAPSKPEGKTITIERRLAVTLKDEAGVPVNDFSVKLIDAFGTVKEAKAAGGTASLTVEVTGSGPDGRPQSRAPFTYEVEHGAITDQGQWDGTGNLIPLQLRQESGTNWSVILLIAGAVLLVGSLAWRQLKRGPAQ